MRKSESSAADDNKTKVTKASTAVTEVVNPLRATISTSVDISKNEKNILKSTFNVSARGSKDA